MQLRRRSIVRALAIAAIPIVLLVAGGVAATFKWRRPEITPAIRGARLAQELGCFACHGAGGVGGAADPTSPGGCVPDWSPHTAVMYVTSEQQIREWILSWAKENGFVGAIHRLSCQA